MKTNKQSRKMERNGNCKSQQIQASQFLGDSDGGNDELLRSAGVKKIRGDHWYTVFFRGVRCDSGTVCGVRHNHLGEIIG